MAELAALAEKLSAADFTSIPVIDMTDATNPEFEKRLALAHQIRDACLNVGFFYVKNSGVDETVVENTFAQSKTFFQQSPAVKKDIDISKSDNFRGYMGLLSENNDPNNKGDFHEAFNLGLDPSLFAADTAASAADESSKLRHSDNQWPSPQLWSGADTFKATTLAYYTEILNLGKRLFPLFALALDLPETFFESKTRHPAAIMRLLFYPGLGDRQVDELMPGIGDHTDFECFTVLRQDDVGGLQVRNHAGDWLDAPCIPGAFVINVGDQFARWSNDIFVSTRHRVLPALKRDRYSVPFFFGCDHDVVMEPIPTCVSDDRPNRYEVMAAGDYVHMRLSETYAAGVKGEGLEPVTAGA